MQSQKIGGARQLKIDTVADLKNSLELHPTLWASTSVPKGLFHLPQNFLNYISPESNILYPQLKNTIEWLLTILKEYRCITEKNVSLSLDLINSTHSDFPLLKKAFEILGITHGNEEEILRQIGLEQKGINPKFIGANGIVPLDCDPNPVISNLLTHIVDFTKGEAVFEEFGVGRNSLTLFEEGLHAYLEYRAIYETAIKEKNTTFAPLLDQTDHFFDTYQRLKTKISDYFKQCKTAKFFKHAFYSVDKFDDYEAERPNFLNPDTLETFLSETPIAKPSSTLTLKNDIEAINPLYQEDFQTLFDGMSTLFGHLECFTLESFNELEKKLVAFKTWKEGNPAPFFDTLSLDALKAIVANATLETVSTLIDECVESAETILAITTLEKLILCNQYIMTLANNFISFHDLYSSKKAIFEQGDLFIDGKHYCFSILVNTIAEHKLHAKNSNIFLLYLTVNAPVRYTIAVPVTAGLRDNLAIGKRGVFKELGGQVYDALIVDLIENPISMKEAFLYPIALIKGVIGKRFQSLTSQNNAAISNMATQAVDGTPIKPTPTASNSNLPMALMGGGVALAAIGSSLTYILSKLLSISAWHMIVILIVVALILVLPSLIVTAYKLKKRDISAILEGSGFAINAQMRLSKELSHIFTKKYTFPLSSIFHR